MRLARFVLALVLAGLMLWPVNPLVRAFLAWVLPEEPTFGDAALVTVIVLLCILLLRPSARRWTPEQ